MKTFNRVLCAAMILSGCAVSQAVLLNAVETSQIVARGDALYLSGAINAKTPGQFRKAVTARTKVLVLCDVPGAVIDSASMELGRAVRARGLGTHLTATSVVVSAGPELFIAGVERSIEAGARIGVHAWTDGVRDAGDLPRDDPAHDDLRGYIAEMLGSEDFYWFEIEAAPNSGMHFLSDAEVARFGLENATAPAPGTYVCPAS